MASQTDKPILWINNEEQGDNVMLRVYQSALGINLVDLKRDWESNYKRYLDLTGDRIKLYDNANTHKAEVEKLCEKYQPALVVFDQLDKIQGFKADREDLLLGSIYIWARELAKKYCPVIGVTQADGTGEGVRYLTMANVSNAKCLDPNTIVLMYNASWKKIKDIQVGELVMGPDSTPRTVLATASGEEEMYRVTHNIGGDSYIVNKSHILSLKNQQGKVVNRNVLDYKKTDFGYRVGVEFPEQTLPIDPYYLGLWLGDGKADAPEITTMDQEIKEFVRDYATKLGLEYVKWQNGAENPDLVQAKIKYKQGVKHPVLEIFRELRIYKNKHIPECYFKSNLNQRLQLLAGLLDSDGTLTKRKHEYFVFSNKNEALAKGVKLLALSCGLFATLKIQNGYFRVNISGNDLSVIPTKVARKQSTYKTHKDVLKSRLTIEPLGEGKFAGIAVDGDHLFIINNMIVTHNTAKQAEADWILGIGKDNNPGLDTLRFLHLSKNKLLGDEDSIPAKRHGREQVEFRPDIARYLDIERNI